MSPAPGPAVGQGRRRILVIKLGALGDVVLASAPFAAIRAHHAGDHITLLTTAAFRDFAAASPWFDAVSVDERPSIWNLAGRRRLRAQLRGFDFVYDLQTSGRSSRYHRLAGAPPWSGIARRASHPDADPNRNALHTRIRQAGQLRQAGIGATPDPDLSWLAAYAPALPGGRVALIVPGAAPHRPRKRWPADRFGAVAAALQARGFTPVVVGGAADRNLAETIRELSPQALDLCGRTSLLELGGVCGRAVLAVGNDTGPMHLAAAMGCACLTLFSAESDPALTAPVGPVPERCAVLRREALADLPAGDVILALGALLADLPPPDRFAS
ncbi:glycosyltransferase family 9 protein [Acetobacteraceae bacterium KSS8]|uniref:Glycosyltransferase family 9 protein n=1 Tax=Endosaccharibacter trunci TaxID=2812733 RepID=A0ABT1WA34_9PROT|nr:glycosyltransferase family 9 protein [Acetobacteraceae bacterium KSS8]